MPVYEYECDKCGKLFEVEQSIKDDPLKTCLGPDCKGKVRRLISASSGVIFKGSGFYQTDYRGNGKPAEKKSEKAEPACESCCSAQKNNCPAAQDA